MHVRIRIVSSIHFLSLRGVPFAFYLYVASLENMSKKFRLKKNSDVIILAIGCSIPEMITNIMSVFDNNKENFNYGFGVIIGSGVFGTFQFLY